MEAPTDQQKIRASNIRAVWDALQAPNWTRSDLVELGKSIYAKRSLKDLDGSLFEQILPRLVEIVERLDTKFTPSTSSSPVAEPSPNLESGASPGDPSPRKPKSPPRTDVSPPVDASDRKE